MTTPIKTLIVDDEPLARSRVRSMLARHGDIDVVAECSSATEAAAVARDEPPSLLMLDVDMPDGGGFELLQMLPENTRPAVVFVTAHEQFALDAFEANAVDYLVKPFSEERLDRAVDRVRRFLGNRELPAPSANSRRRRERFAVRVRGQVVFVNTSAIDWIGAEGNYVRLHAGGQSYLMRESMQSVDAELDPAMFVRVHRSAIVNIERVRKLIPGTDGAFSIVLSDDTTIPLGPTYRERLENVLGQKL